MSFPFLVFDNHVASLLEGLPGRGDSTKWLTELVRPFERLDSDLLDIARGIADIENAVGPVLDIVGSGLGEERNGLLDLEYRRLLACALVAEDAVSTVRIWVGWCALLGNEEGSYRELPPASIALSGRVDWVPSHLWIGRAGPIVSRLIGAGYHANASISTKTDGAKFDSSPGFDSGRFAYSLPVMGY